MYNINISPGNNASAKLVMSVRAAGKPPAGRTTNCILIICWASYVTYLYSVRIYINIYISIGCYIFQVSGLRSQVSGPFSPTLFESNI